MYLTAISSLDKQTRVRQKISNHSVMMRDVNTKIFFTVNVVEKHTKTIVLTFIQSFNSA